MPLLFLFVLFLLPVSPAAGQTPLRVMTYNIHHGENVHGVLDLDAVAAVIEAEDVDVVALQEVDRFWSDRSAHVDQVAALAERLGMFAFFAPIYDRPSALPGRPNRMYGLAILSRHPIVDAANHKLSRLSTVDDEPEVAPMPGFPEIVIELEGTRIRLLNTHLDFRSDPAVRQIQVDETLRIIGRTDEPVILMGDLNARPDAPELQPLGRVLVDAWDRSGRGDGFTFPAERPDRRIDYIFVSDGVEVESVHVVESTASDHRPVVATLNIHP